MDGPTRWVIVDDTSSEINYIGTSWFADVRSWDTVGSFGMPYLSTQHGTRGTAKFTFDFTGSAIAVLGTNLGSKAKYWTCSVDGVALESTSSSPICTSPCNNSLFCNATALADAPHTLTVEARPTGNQTFWFDRVEYVASQKVSRERKAIRITPWDPDLVGTKGKVFTFYGASVSWYGSIPALFNGSAFNLSWSMDQGDSNYTWDWRASSLVNPSYPLQNQKFFETPTYPMGMHTLRVSDTVDFRYLIVQNGTVPFSSTTSVISSPSTTGTMVAKSGISGREVGGIIAGGVIGGILFFGIVVLVTCFCRRRMGSQRRVESYLDKPFFDDQKPDDSPNSRRLNPLRRKSILLPGHLPYVAYTPDTTPSVRSHIRVRTTMDGPPTLTSTSNWTPTPTSALTSGTNGFNANHFGEQGQPPPLMPPIVQGDVAVDVGQANRQPRIGQVPQARAAVVHLPPEYTPD